MHEAQPNDNFVNLAKSETLQDTIEKVFDEAEITEDTSLIVVDSVGSTKAPTRAEIGRHRRQHFTVQHQKVQPCGHKFVPGSEPRHRNCEPCWFTFFTVYGELTKQADELFRSAGEGALVQVRGRNFTSNFKKYMATIAQWKATSEAAQAQEASQDGITEGSIFGPGSTGGDEPVSTNNGTDSTEDGEYEYIGVGHEDYDDPDSL